MKQAVIVKGNINKGTKGVTVILNPDIPFAELVKHTADKFRELSAFLKQEHMAVAFEGRVLSIEQEQTLLDVITDSCNIEILYLMEDDPQKEMLYAQRIEAAQYTEEKPSEENMFYRGTLRSGQVFESENNIVIIGDVNPGGKVVSGGSIIILGSLRGIACAGISGNRESFVAALDMQPMQLRIDNVVGTCDKSAKNRIEKGLGRKLLSKKTAEESYPKIAVLKGNDICIENLDKETISTLPFS